MSSLYERIVSLCELRGMTQYRLAKDAGISQGILSGLKTGRKKSVSAEVANKIAETLNTNPQYLLTGEGDSRSIAAIKLDNINFNDLIDIERKRPEDRTEEEQRALDLFNSIISEPAKDLGQALKSLAERTDDDKRRFFKAIGELTPSQFSKFVDALERLSYTDIIKLIEYAEFLGSQRDKNSREGVTGE